MKNIGIDIGKKKCFICVMDEKGTILEESNYDNTLQDAEIFAKSMVKKYKKCQAVCESTGNMWIKTFESFEKNDITIKLANPLKNKAIAEASIKTDKVDARTLAHLLRADLVAQCHVSAWKIRDQKQILRHRISLVQDRTKVSNRMNNLLDKYDLQTIGNHITGVKNLQWLSEQRLPMSNDDYMMHQCIRQIRYLNDEIKQIEKVIGTIASQNEDAKRIMSMTGFDSFGALLISLEIDGIDRFPTPKKLISWMGMCPTVHQSGNTTYHGKMKKDSNRQVNWMMTQAANTASFKDERMMQVYQRARKKHPHGVAVSHVANKIGTIIWHLLNSKTLYNERKDSLYARKLKKIENLE
jgi:transposase